MASNTAAKTRKLRGIACEFVRQYYKLLNGAPNYIHNFYNHNSTFIYGTIEVDSDRQAETAFGRSQIETKMKELKLNDCRTKIEQIDCLETLAGGLVIQVIGQLSNNGRPMRRFLQTFVLAPCHQDQSNRKDGDQLSNSDKETGNKDRTNQKFYVLNSIFRYQDDGFESDIDEETVGVPSNNSIEEVGASTGQIIVNNGNEMFANTKNQSTNVANSKQNLTKQTQPQVLQQPTNVSSSAASVVSDNKTQQNQQPQMKQSDLLPEPQQRPIEIQSQVQPEPKPQLLTADEKTAPIKSTSQQANSAEPTLHEHKRTDNNTDSATMVVSSQGNGRSNSVAGGNKSTEVPEDKIENNKSSSGEQTVKTVNTNESATQIKPSANQANSTVPSQQPPPPAPKPNEPKTWANILSSKNSNPVGVQQASTSTPSNSTKNVFNDQQHQHSQSITTQAPHHPQDHATPQQQMQQPNDQRNNRRRSRKSSNKQLMINRSSKDRPRPAPAGKPLA